MADDTFFLDSCFSVSSALLLSRQRHSPLLRLAKFAIPPLYVQRATFHSRRRIRQERNRKETALHGPRTAVSAE